MASFILILSVSRAQRRQRPLHEKGGCIVATVDSLDIQIAVTANQVNVAMTRLNNQLNTLCRGLSAAGLSASTNFSKITKNSSKVTGSFKNVNKIADEMTNRLKIVTRRLFTLRTAFKTVKSSMDYIETLNYFERAFGQVAEKADLSNFAELGYASAEEYVNSFAERAKELTSKMSGFNINADGTLTASGLPSLGLNPEKLMNYQAMFAQMSSSMGVASETSLKLSDALTRIGADLASVKNMKFEKVWEDMAAGLVGQSRVWDKYGANIRSVNLQQKLNELGIKANIQALNQNDKALLRTIILLDSTRYSWADLSQTLNQPANQLRLIQGNLQNLSRTIGNLFLPIVAKVLPYINAFTIALQRFFAWLGKIFKVDISDLLPKGGGGGSGIGDLIEDTEELEDGFDKATAAAKKLNKSIRAFDELKTISINDGGGTGGTGAGGIGGGLLDAAFDEAYKEYLEAWDAAFSGIEDKANETADKIQAFFENLFKPISNAWGEEGGFVLGSWKNALKEISKLVKDIGRDFNTMWQQQETVDIFTDIFHIVDDIGLTVGNLAENFKIAWGANKVGLHIFENMRDIIGVIVGNIRDAADFTAKWSETLNFYPLLSSIEEWTESLVPVFDSLSGVVTDFYTDVLLPLGKWALEDGIPELLDVFKSFNEKVNWQALRDNLSEFWKHLEPFAETVGEGLIIFIERVSDLLADFLNSETFVNFLHDIGDWMDNVTPEQVADGIEKLAKAFIAFKLSILGFTAVKTVVPIITNLASLFKKHGIFGGLAFSAGATAQVFDVFKNTKEFGDTQKKFDETTAKIMELNEQFNAGQITLEEYNKRVEEARNELDEFTSSKFKIPGVEYDESGFNIKLVELKNKIIKWWDTDIKGTFSSWGKDIENFWTENVSPWFTKEKWQEFGENIKTAISTKWNEFKDWWATTGFYSWWTENVSPWFTLQKWQELGQGIYDGISAKWNEFKDWWENTAIVSWWDNNVAPWFTLEKWLELAKNIKEGISTKWGETATEWSDNITNWWNNSVAPWFKLEKWTNLLSKIPDAFKTAFKNAANGAIAIFNTFIDWLNKKMHFEWDAIEIMGQQIVPSGNVQLFTIPKIPQLAKGAVFKGGNPYMAIVNDQPRGQTNIEAPLKTIQEALHNELGKWSSKSYQIASPPSFEDMYSDYRQAAEKHMPEYGGGGTDTNSEMASMIESAVYRAAYNAVSAAIGNSKLLNDQKDMVQGILNKPSMGIGELGRELVRDSMLAGGNIRGGRMSRLAVAEEVYR